MADNLVQLGGTITEKVAPKTSSEDYLVTNNTAQIIVSKPILELIRLKATLTAPYDAHQGITYPAGTEIDLTNFIYERAIYNLLSVDYAETPNKGIAMYYELGENIIKGGDYQLPQAYTNAYTDYSFKKILYVALTGVYKTDYNTFVDGTGDWYDIKVNDFVFEVTYRTKDSARLEHTRPDLRHYLLSSKHDKVPMHRQFNNQQDILVDSDAFGNNMFGKLIRTGNSNYKTREWCRNYSELKHKGELYRIDGDLYYVAKVTNIFFPDHISSVVEYSKDYNQLSAIIGIPSEPRFYEISERAAIDREVSINDYLLVTTDENKIDTSSSFLNNIEHTKNLIFGGGGTFLRWANTKFKGDPNLNFENGTFGVSDFEKTVISPVNPYSCGNTLTYEWDMQDNFSAGDQVSAETQPPAGTKDRAYRTLKAVQYCDKYGKSTLFDFSLYSDIDFSADEIRALPESPIVRGSDIAKEVLIDAREGLSARYFLIDLEGNPISPSQTDVISVYKAVGYKAGTVTTEATFSADPTYGELDTAILANTGIAAHNGDTVVATIEATPGVVSKISIFKRYTLLYTETPIFDSATLGEYRGNCYFRWDFSDNNYVGVSAGETANNVVSNLATGKSLVLLKDSRETLHFNYNLMQITDSDRFVLSPFFFVPNKTDVKIVLLNQEVNKMSNGYVSLNAILYTKDHPTITAANKKITVDMSWIENEVSDEILAQAQSIAIIGSDTQNDGTSVTKFIIAKNGEVYADNWHFGAPSKENLFVRRQ